MRLNQFKAKIRELSEKNPLTHKFYRACVRAYQRRFSVLDSYLDQYLEQRLYGSNTTEESAFYAHFPIPPLPPYSSWQEVDYDHYTQILLEKKGFNQAFKDKFKGRKPVVLFAGNDEHQDKSGFIQDLQKVCEKLYLFHKDDGSYGTAHYGYTNGRNRFSFYQEANSYVNTAIICDIIDRARVKPDLLIIQAWGWNYTPRDLLKIKHRYKDLKILNLQMDDRACYNLNRSLGTHAILPFIDLALSTAPERVEWILKEGTPAFYMPLASSLDFYHPLEGVEKIYDIGFVGANQGIRGQIIQALERENFKVKAYGYGFGGRLPLEQTNAFFNQCELVLGCGNIGSLDFINMKLRDFDAPMSGAAYITTYNPDLQALFDKDCMIFYKDIAELISKARYYLEHKEALQAIREKAFFKASSQHTYEQRFLEIFERILLH
ncbi:glycosyltransferase family protein [Helicobacter vulpis]|uniref:glycosyltransferase family protein n=1 Tax=Helicobacter vulpis TaxID=2316076 RepID=UPI000EB1288A|nr:glycosyltransferase [Helicobacter vulpis]